MFTPGRIAFIIFFVIVFVGVLIWSYSKERKLNKVHFRKSYLVLLAIILFIVVQFLIVKLL